MTDQQEDKFEIALRLFGQEIVGMSLISKSKMRNWVVLSMICLVPLVASAAQYGPGIKALMQ